MQTLITPIIAALQNDGRAVLATVLSTEGSVPRTTGAAMLVRADGSTLGTVGGGQIEFTAAQMARSLAHGSSCVKEVSGLSAPSASGAQCGGRVTILFQSLRVSDLPLFERAAAHCKRNAGAWFVRRLEHGKVAEAVLHSDDRPCGFFTPRGRNALYVNYGDGTALLAEPIGMIRRVYLFGAGHVAQKLAGELARLGFLLTVIDGRAALLESAAFDCAAQRILADPAETAARLPITENDYAIVMASSHETDLRILLELLRKPPSYIGCLGSRRKIAMAKERVREAGLPEEAFSRVHAPIGLPIRAETPEEIAVSIAAELILFRAEQQSRA